jgi:hypothetical protein
MAARHRRNGMAKIMAGVAASMAAWRIEAWHQIISMKYRGENNEIKLAAIWAGEERRKKESQPYAAKAAWRKLRQRNVFSEEATC